MTTGLNGDTVLNVDGLTVGYVRGTDYGYRHGRWLRVTVDVTMERIERPAITVDHEPITDHLDYSITTAVWNWNNTDWVTGGATIEPLEQVLRIPERAALPLESIRTLIASEVWHLNTLQAACSHMDVTQLVREPDRFSPTGDRIACGPANMCPVSDYTYGAAWLVRPLPDGFEQQIRAAVEA